MKNAFTHLLIAALAAGGTWLLMSRLDHPAHEPSGAGGKKLLYYQSPMHPWIKSDKPGNCTVCGMKLVPIYEGDKAPDAAAAETGIVMLPPGAPNVIGVHTTEVKKQPLTRTLRVAGTIDDDDSRHRILSAYTKGRIEKLFVNYVGADVEAGQPLALFYSPDLLSAARDYKLAVKQGGEPLQKAAATRLLQLGLAREQITKVPERADDDLYFEILSPMNGTVVKRAVYEGQYVEEGAPLFELADFRRMWFQFIAYEQDLPFLKIGQPVEIRTPSLPGKAIETTITFINPNLDEMTRSARVRAEFDNPVSSDGLHRGHEILHRLYADATVKVEAPEVLTVPIQAVLWSNRQPRVYVEKAEAVYEQRRVKLGRLGDAYFEVLEGLKEGERVALTGNMLIDSQAQLDAMVGGAAPEPPTEVEPAITAADGAALSAYFAAVDAVNIALADDDLAAANAALKKLPPAPALLKAQTTPPASNGDIKELRKAFLPWSQELAEAAAKLRSRFPDLRIFRCPMTNDLWSGAPANAKWIQLSAELRNPYWGREMRDCGAEVRP